MITFIALSHQHLIPCVVLREVVEGKYLVYSQDRLSVCKKDTEKLEVFHPLNSIDIIDQVESLTKGLLPPDREPEYNYEG